MNEFYKLRNRIMRYDWGSPVDIPRLMGIAADNAPPDGGVPSAELWMGSHPGAPSMAVSELGEISLGELISGDPRRFLGEKTARQYGALPFLFKLLAAEKPLSIQVHPNLARAREGFERENSIGLAMDSPIRNYRDPNHKPEIIAALTPFTGLCGFRDTGEIRGLLADFLKPATAVLREGFIPLTDALSNSDSAAALRDFLTGLFGLSQTVREALTQHILSISRQPREWELMRDMARLHPGDPAVISPLYLNIFRLEPGEAVFLEAGVLHAYVHGFGVELMASSDNVLRGGLTGKHIDVPELMKALDFKPFKPLIIAPNASCFTYPTPCAEFSLTRICGSGAGGNAGDRDESWPPSALDAPSILIVTEGELVVMVNHIAVFSACDSRSGGETVVKQGESLFIPADTRPLSLKGRFTLYIASCGCAASVGCGVSYGHL